MHKLDLTQEERDYMGELRMLTTDSQDNEVIVGLSRDESTRYIESNRVFLAGDGGNLDINDYMALQEKHERARMGAIKSGSRQG
ncbi:hypothetical protein [Halomonas sp. WWR20]